MRMVSVVRCSGEPSVPARERAGIPLAPVADEQRCLFGSTGLQDWKISRGSGEPQPINWVKWTNSGGPPELVEPVLVICQEE